MYEHARASGTSARIFYVFWALSANVIYLRLYLALFIGEFNKYAGKYNKKIQDLNKFDKKVRIKHYDDSKEKKK